MFNIKLNVKVGVFQPVFVPSVWEVEQVSIADKYNTGETHVAICSSHYPIKSL